MDTQAEDRQVKDMHAKAKSMKERCIGRIKNNCRMKYDGERPLNVAFIGFYGAGKSSLINTIGTSFRGYWEEHAMCGSYGGHGKPLTVNVESFPKCCQGNNEDYQDWNLPTLTDVAGFPDECNDKWEELFRILFYGRLKAGESLVEAVEYADIHGVEDLRRRYTARSDGQKEEETLDEAEEDADSHGFEDLGRRYTARSDGQKVDRVVYVQAMDTPIKENLIKCMLRAAHPSRTGSDNGGRAIPVYGVLTKADRVDDGRSTATIEEDFLACLGLKGNKARFLLCKNYCVDVNPGQDYLDQADPELDLPVLNWFAQVSNRALKVQQDDHQLQAVPSDRPGLQLRPYIHILRQYLVKAFEVVLMYYVIMHLFWTSYAHFFLDSDCNSMLLIHKGNSYPVLSQLCEEIARGWGVILDFLFKLLVLGAVRYGPFLFEKFLSDVLNQIFF